MLWAREKESHRPSGLGQPLYFNTLISCVTDTFLCHSTAATSTMHRAAPVATAANPRAHGAAACTAAPVRGERPQLTLPQ